MDYSEGIIGHNNKGVELERFLTKELPLIKWHVRRIKATDLLNHPGQETWLLGHYCIDIQAPVNDEVLSKTFEMNEGLLLPGEQLHEEIITQVKDWIDSQIAKKEAWSN